MSQQDIKIAEDLWIDIIESVKIFNPRFMEITFFHKNIAKWEEEQFVDYVNEKLPVIKNLLTKFAQDATILKVSIEKFNKHEAYEVEFCLILPTKSIVATEASHGIHKAIDLSKDRLISQLKKHMALLRKARSHSSIRDLEPELKDFEALEQLIAIQ